MLKDVVHSTGSAGARPAMAMLRRCATALLACLAWCAIPVFAQAYPNKPIRIVVPNPAGGNDIYLRVIMPKMLELLGQPLVIENRPGASGAIGAENIARAAPDGYSLLFCTSAQIVIGPFLNRNLPYDTVRDFTPISKVLEPVIAVTVNAAVPVNSMRELIDHAKRNPGKLSYGSSGPGSVPHFDGEMIKSVAGVDILHVPYKGIAQIVPELLAGRLDLAYPAYGGVAAHLAAGKVKVLAVLDATRHPRLPDIPTLRESLPEFRRAPLWFSLFGPAGMPRAVVERFHGALVKALETPEVRANFESGYMRIIGGTPAELAASIKADIELTGGLVKAIGLKSE